MTRRSWDHDGRSAHDRGYGRRHRQIRQELLRTVVTCEECARRGRVTLGEIADHIVPLAKGGSGDRSNYQLLCRACSRDKDAADKGHKVRPRIGPDGWPEE